MDHHLEHKMTSHSKVCQRWVDRADGTTSLRALKGSRIFEDGDTLYSYGRHFALGHVLRRSDGTPHLFLLNGDRYSVSTTRHQGELRSAVSRSKLPHVIVPFEALHAAGIDVSSVELVEALPDRTEETVHRTTVQPEGSVWRDVPVYSYLAEGRFREQTGTRRVLYRNARTDYQSIEVEQTEDGPVYSWTTYRHWLGESLLRATVRVRKRLRCHQCVGGRTASCVECHQADPRTPAGGWHIDGCSRRFDYDSSWARCEACSGYGVKIVRHSRTRLFLSGFDRNELRPSYFFCELPKEANGCTSVEEALEALKPDTVKLAEQMGRTVHRQGDIFAVQLVGVSKRQLTKQGARYDKRGTLLGTNHVGTEVAYLPDGTTLVRGSLVHAPDNRAADHARVRLGDGWFVVVKNTVPVSK